jgi:hypothetical protein
LVRHFHHTSPDRVQDNVTYQFQEIIVTINEYGLVASLKHMPYVVVTSIEESRIDPV